MANPVKNYKMYDYISRYESFPYQYDKENNRYCYGLISWLRGSTSYVIYEVKPGDSYDSIALDHYGCALFYWIICDYNRIFDTITPPEVGTLLKIPPLNAVAFKEN